MKEVWCAVCKVLIITNTAKVTDLKKLVEVSHDELKSQRDGFGWAAQKIAGGFFGERTNSVFSFKTMLEQAPNQLPWVEQSHNTFGEVGEHRAFMAHGRISTNNPALVNVHPIIKGDYALIHNGVVTDHGPAYEMQTTNDSEHVLQNLIVGGLKDVQDNLTGYYAFGVFLPDGRLLVVRDKIADLYCAYVTELESYVYGTTKDLVQSVINKMMWGQHTAIAKVIDDSWIMHKVDGSYTYGSFVSRGRDAYSALHAEKSLGRKLDAEPVQSVIPAVGNTWPISKTERKAMQKKLIDACKDHNERKSLAAFFRYINDTKSNYEALRASGEVIRSDLYKRFTPGTQLQFDVIDSKGHIKDPYNMDSKAMVQDDFSEDPNELSQQEIGALLKAHALNNVTNIRQGAIS